MLAIEATLNQPKATNERVLDDLIVLFEANGKDATCGLVQNKLLVYIEEDLLSPVINITLRYAKNISFNTF